MFHKFFANRIENWPFWSHLPDASSEMWTQIGYVVSYGVSKFNISQFCLQKSYTKPHCMLIECFKSLLHTDLKIDHFGTIQRICCQLVGLTRTGVWIFLTNVNFSGNDNKSRAGHLKFLVRLEKLLERRGDHFRVASKMRNFIRRDICLDESQS